MTSAAPTAPESAPPAGAAPPADATPTSHPSPAPTSPVLGPEDLAEMIRAYSAVAERMQSSHEALQNEVLRLREELATKNEQLARSKRLSALGEMAAGIAHEIRNPLAAIQLYVEMVRDDLSDLSPLAPAALPAELRDQRVATASDNTGKIAGAVRGLSAIVNDVLSFARQIQPAARLCDARQLLDRLLQEQAPLLEARQIRCELQVRARHCFVDPDLMHQALLNLVRNAADAMAPQGGGTLTLAVDQRQIWVGDTGPGLPDDVIDRIFNPFFTTRSTGTGLGLAIVHRIVDAHGGSIRVDHHPQHGGAIFRLQLPPPPDADKDADLSNTSPAAD